MDQDSIRILDDVNDLDTIEVHYLTATGDMRTAVGFYAGLRRSVSGWCLRLVQKPAIQTIDIQQIRILTPQQK